MGAAIRGKEYGKQRGDSGIDMSGDVEHAKAELVRASLILI